MFYGYDQTGIKRIYGETLDQAHIAALEYFASRPDCSLIRLRKIGRNGKPMLQGGKTITRPQEGCEGCAEYRQTYCAIGMSLSPCKYYNP